MTRRTIRYVVVCLLLMPFSVYAQQPSCMGEEYRQFDFWIGEWKVSTPTNANNGLNSVEMAHNGCVITEHYSTPNGYTGQSLNAYDRVTGTWNQTWVDNGGLVLKLSGGMEGKSMVMSGEGTDQQGNAIEHRITWTPKPNGTVTQIWESKPVNGGEWKVLFDGLYTKIK